MIIEIGDKQYNVKVAKSESERKSGLSKLKELPENEGMLFDFSEDVGEKSFWMKDTLIPLDIIFIDEDKEVISVHEGIPNDETPITELNVAYVLEVNAKSGITEDDELEFEDEDDDEGPVMKVLNPDGSEQMLLWGGERIISRRETKTLINKAKKADKSKSDADYKALGRYIFKVFKTLDNREPEYVEKPN